MPSALPPPVSGTAPSSVPPPAPALPPDELLEWYRTAARDLPWRQPETTPWGVLVSEIMLQQTPVARVEPAWHAWLARWPTPAALAAEPAGEAVRMWGKLGYPRRALRLREAAIAITHRHGGEVPADVDALLALPGIGAYTARAVASFAFGQRHPVVDTNVRRVLARAVTGAAEPGPPRTAADLALAESVLPEPAAVAAVFAVAVMELGATVCTARAPRCGECPVAGRCAWVRAGRPEYTGPRARPQGFAGTDRQVRGRLLDVLRAADAPVPAAALDVAWPEAGQRDRALASLLTDGLVVRHPGPGSDADAVYALP